MSSTCTKRTGFGRGARLCGLFAIAFVMVSTGLSLYFRSISPMPYFQVLTPKLNIYQARADEYDTLFIGDSQTQYHVLPEAVEDGATAAGCLRPNVFNFGVFGLQGVEQDWLIGEVSKIGAGHVRRIVIGRPQPEPRAIEDATTSRRRYFLSPALYGRKADNIANYAESAPKRLFRFGVFLYSVAYDLSGVGRGAETAFPEKSETSTLEIEAGFMKEDGFEALDELDFEANRIRHKAFIEDLAAFDRAVAAYGSKTRPNIAARAKYLRRKLDAIAANGLKSAYYVSPDPDELDRTGPVGDALDAITDHPVLNYNRPDLYPDLFDRSLWYDPNHVGRKGARLISERIGRDLCEAGFFEDGS